MKKVLVGAAFGALVFASPVSAATTVFFSDFETESVGRTSGFTTVNTAGVWTSEPGSAGIELQFGNTGGAPFGSPNRVKVELDSTRNSGMFYTFLTSGTFTLDFLFSPRPNVGPLSNMINVLLDNQSLASPFTGGPNSGTVWSSETVLPFTATAGQKLIFRASGTSDSLGGYLDNIRLTQISAVPEPGTWMMMLLGLGFVGGAMRTAKRRQKITFNYA